MARGSIEWIDTNKWRIRYDIPKGADGKRRQKTETIYGVRRQAERRLTEIEHDILGNRYVEPTEMTLAEYLDHWVRNYAEIAVRPRTLKGYHSIIRSHLKKNFGSVKVKHLTASQVQEYYAMCIRAGLSAHTVTHIHRLLSHTLKQAVRWNMLQRNVLEDVTPPSRKRPEIRILTNEEIDILLDEAKGADCFLPIHLGFFTGMRRSEILGLQFRDVNLEARILRVTRTMVDITGDQAHIDEPKSRQSKRTITLREVTVDLLRSHYRTHAARMKDLGKRLTGPTQLCLRADGGVLTPDALSKAFRKTADRCGFEGVRFHDLRHTHASLLLAAGVPIHVVQARLGHASIQTTIDVYGHLMPDADALATHRLEHFVSGSCKSCSDDHDHIDSTNA